MPTARRLITTFVPEHYELTITVARKDRKFDGTVVINGHSVSGGPISVHAKDLIIKDVVINGHAASFVAKSNDELQLSSPDLSKGNHVVVISFEGIITDAMHGMYPCYYVHNDEKKELIATQFESHHAREVFPCIDEPEAKATFDVTLATEQDVTVLGNMPIIRQAVEDNSLVTTFDTSPRMSTYLLAWVYGELHSKSALTKNGVEVNIWATKSQPAKSLDFALDIATRTIDFFDEYFGIKYPLPKSDHVALPDFSSGAMENWGLITYREITLLADPETTSISTKHYIATVIAHELSHQWFGNLVTMKWWNNLWLNESFATVMEYIAVDALEPDWKVWLDFVSNESIMALRRDAIDGVQPVQVDVSHPDEISTLFDGAIVYAKGARLLRMLREYIGDVAFREGLKNYFLTHSYQNTEADDLWKALSKASGKDVGKFMTAWISQPGYPVVNISKDELSQTQFFMGAHEPSHRIWPIPLGSSGSELPAIFDSRKMRASVKSGTRLNPNDSAHFITHYSDEMLEELIANVSQSSPTQRLQLLHEQTLLARAGLINSANLVPLLSAYKNEENENVWNIIALTIVELKKFVRDDEAGQLALKRLTKQLAAHQYERLGWKMKANESEEDSKLRATVISLMLYAEDEAATTHAETLFKTKDLRKIDPELRASVLEAVVRRSKNGAVVKELLKDYRTTHSADLQMDICSGVTATRSKSGINQVLESLTVQHTIRHQDVARWFAYMMRNRHATDETWQWMKDNWAWIEKTYGGDKSFDDFARYSAGGIMTRQLLDEYKKFFTPLAKLPTFQRVVPMGILEIEGRLDTIERDGDAVRAALLNL